jgi:hypothetical protein
MRKRLIEIAQRKGNKEMTTATAPKAPKEIEISTLIKDAYSDLSGSARDAMIYFVRQSALEIREGRVSLRVGRDSIKQAIKETGAISDISASSFDYMEIAEIILDKDGAEKETVKSVLTLSAKLQKLTSKDEAISKASKAKTYAEIVDAVAEMKDDAQAEKESAQEESDAETLKEITLERIVDAVDDYLKNQSLKDLKTTELKKLESVIARLATVAKNSKVA